MENDNIVESVAEAQRREFVEGFKNYGMLLDTMSPGEFSVEIGKSFPHPQQAAIIAVMLSRIIKLEASRG